MDLHKLLRRVAASVPDRYSCSHMSRSKVRVETPILYPDGGIVDVFVVEREGAWCVTDFGEASGWLDLMAVTFERSPRQDQMIDEICRTLGVTDRDGCLELWLETLDEVGDAVVRVAQAVGRVAAIAPRQ